MKWTEQHIQAVLFRHLVEKGHTFIAPNCKALGYEADLISVSTSGLCYEYEIKVDAYDFYQDAKKEHKHTSYRKAQLGCLRKPQTYVPSRFYYVVPRGLVPHEDIPEHAGLMELEGNLFETVKTAPRLHSNELQFPAYRGIATSLMWKVFKGVVKRQTTVRTRWGG